jgi:hypothetical protein
MRIIWIILISVAGLVLVGGASFFIFFNEKCPSSCDDLNNCTRDYCSKDTDYRCKNDLLRPCDGNGICEHGEYGFAVDCPNCTDENVCTEDVFNYEKERCFHFKIFPCDGDGICSEGEFGKSDDCPTCDDDNNCTIDDYDVSTKTCSHEIIKDCCGNLICEIPERFSTCNQDCLPTIQEVSVFCGTDDNCKMDYAIKLEDEEVCFLTTVQDNVNDCITKIATIKKDADLCSLSFFRPEYNEIYGRWFDQYYEKEKDIDACEKEVIISMQEPNLCLDMLNYPNSCLEELAIIMDNTSICEMIIQESGFVDTKRSLIEKCISIVKKDYSLCKFIDKKWIADDCISAIAKTLNNTVICQEHSAPGECEKEVNLI